MPTISVDKYALFEALGQKYTTDEFQDLCFAYGIELDDDDEDQERPIVNGAPAPPTLKIEMPANRYDMLCFEGISRTLAVFQGVAQPPKYKLARPASGKLEKITVSPETMKVRPLIAGAVLRNITFTPERYESFIALQDKLHSNLARNRSLVSIGTHDLDTVKGPFRYEAYAPKDIRFVPLNQTKEYAADELMEYYEKEKTYLAKFVPIIKEKPVWPVVEDANKVICSLPPIINGDRSKISVNTKNVFIEVTAIDETKLGIVLDMMVTMFSVYCEDEFTVEPIEIVSEHNGASRITPSFEPLVLEVEHDYLQAGTGLKESREGVCKLLEKMAYEAKPSSKDQNLIEVTVPLTRPDVLHQCDILEDVAVCYGFNNLPQSSATKSATIAKPMMLNKLTDVIRLEAAMAGWSEVLPLILCSHDENFRFLNRKDDGSAVRLANPKTQGFEVVRTSLLPGLLKTINHNRSHSLPIKIFECSDVAFKDESLERKSYNERHFAAAWCGKTSGFQEVHGLLDRVLLMLRTAFLTHEEGLVSGDGKSIDFNVVKTGKPEGYWIEQSDDPLFFHGHGASIHVRLGGKQHQIGQFGILHPSVLESFELKYPVSTLEFNLEAFM